MVKSYSIFDSFSNITISILKGGCYIWSNRILEVSTRFEEVVELIQDPEVQMERSVKGGDNEEGIN